MSRPQPRSSEVLPLSSLDVREEYELSVEDAQTILCKIVERAILDIRLGPNPRNEELNAAYEDARQWIFSDDPQFPSFLGVCGYIDLDPDAVREKIEAEDREHGR